MGPLHRDHRRHFWARPGDLGLCCRAVGGGLAGAGAGGCDKGIGGEEASGEGGCGCERCGREVCIVSLLACLPAWLVACVDDDV